MYNGNLHVFQSEATLQYGLFIKHEKHENFTDTRLLIESPRIKRKAPIKLEYQCPSGKNLAFQNFYRQLFE